MSKKVNRSEIIPEIGTAARRILISEIFKTQPFKDSINKGRPFFTEEELEQIEKKYPEGMTWKEIEKEVSRKGLIFKKPTFRKYIQNKWIPGAIKNQEKHGKELKYPNSIIKDINFVKFLISEDSEDIKAVLKIFIDTFGQYDEYKYGETLYNVLNDKTQEDSLQDLRISIYDLLIVGDPTISCIINDLDDSLEENAEHKKNLKNKMDEIEDTFYKCLEPKVDDFIQYTEENKIKISFEEVYSAIIKKFL